MRIADFRSDTLTKPTPGMRKAMMDAEVGDDVFGEDPTINRLQELIAEMTGKEAALFVTSGTQANQICINAHTYPGEEIIVDRESHIFNYEAGGAALLSGVQLYPVDCKNGFMTVEEVEFGLRHDDVHYPQTSLICLENTLNRAGGTIFPFEEIKKISQFSKKNNLKMHFDGARLWNASIATGISIKDYAGYFDSIMLSFSKGMGAPVGSVVAGDIDFVKKAYYYRKVYGGGWRQAGILAAGCIYAIENHFDRLGEDHQRAKYFAEEISKIPAIKIDLSTVETNIVIFDVDIPDFQAIPFLNQLKENSVLMLDIDPNRIRAVTHLDLIDEDVDHAIRVIKKILK